MRGSFNKTKRFFEKNERILIPGMLVLGLVVDFVTFRSIKLETAFTILIVYLIVAGLAIAYFNTPGSLSPQAGGKARNFFLRYLRLVTPLIIQFTFGALLSASLIFYWFSGSFSASWPIILIIAILMASNDVLRHHYLKPIVQISVYFFILFSIGSLILPYLLNSVDAGVFILAGATSLVVILAYIAVLSKYLTPIKKVRPRLLFSVVIIFLSINGLYLLNVIPPIPLSLREAGVYHSVERVDDGYLLIGEEESFLERFLPGTTVHIEPGQRIYIYSSIFAPTELNTVIVHEWQFYNPDEREWITRSMPSFPIVGGRGEGYRGYSFSSNIKAGEWRVSIETKRGQVLGRIGFDVEIVEIAPLPVETLK